MDGTVTRTLGHDVTVGLQAGYVNGTLELLGVGPLNDFDQNPFQHGDVSLFLNSKHVELRAFVEHFDGTATANAAYIGQTALPDSYNTNVLDGEAQYIDKFETGRGIEHDLHVGTNYRLKALSWTFITQNETENHFGFFVHDEVKLGKVAAIIGDYRADYVPYLDRVVQSPRASLLIHPSRQSTIRGIVGTAFRTPTFLEAYLDSQIQLPVTGSALLSQELRQAELQAEPRRGVHDGGRLPQFGERIFHVR